MDSRGAIAEARTERRPVRILTVLCVVYALLLLYASLMPFDFYSDRTWVNRQLRMAWQYWPFGHFHASRSDIFSNVMVYFPIGLLIATRLSLARRPRRWAAFLAGVALSGGISLAVEYAQAFTPPRVSSATDFLMNLIGGSAGAAVGSLVGAGAWLRLVSGIRETWAKRPLALVAALLLLLLAADAAYPYLPTLDVSTVKRHIRDSAFSLEAGFSRHPWHQWAIDRVGVYAVLTILLGAASRRDSPGKWAVAALWALCFACWAEDGKIFIESRAANVANIVSSAGGALLGFSLAVIWPRRLPPRLRRLLPVLLLGAYVVYFEWTPFVFEWDLARVAERMPKGAAWLPLYHYAMGGRAEDVRLFLRTIVLLGALAYAATLLWPRLAEGRNLVRILKAAALAGCLGLVLEFGQIFLERVPSITDVFCFAVGSALGAWVYVCYPPPEPST